MDPRAAYPGGSFPPSNFYTLTNEKKTLPITNTYAESNTDLNSVEEAMRKLYEMKNMQRLPPSLNPGFMQGDYFIRNKDGAVLASLKQYGEHFHIEFFAAINNEQYVTVWLSRDQAETEIRRVCKALQLAC